MDDFETVRSIYKQSIGIAGLHPSSLLEDALDRIEARVRELEAEQAQYGKKAYEHLREENERLRERDALVQGIADERNELLRQRIKLWKECDRLREALRLLYEQECTPGDMTDGAIAAREALAEHHETPVHPDIRSLRPMRRLTEQEPKNPWGGRNTPQR